MSETNNCPECGAALPASAPRGLCPACLLKRGLETNTIGCTADATPAARWTPPAVEELATRFPELEFARLIGRGGMGAVYEARQKNLQRVVALKILPPELGNDPAFAERFAREAQAMARLNHPHIVAIYEFGERAGWYYFVMEFVDGMNLRGLLDSGHISPKEALAIVPQICEALQYAHDQGIVHRDIKPENILLNKQGQVKIADFGLAKLIGCAPSAAGTVERMMGTPQYMAPEQTEHPDKVDHRADIFSLGVVFYQMLTGDLPTGKFEPPSHKVVIDVRLDEVVLRAMQREPQKRYQQVSEVKTEVETIAAAAEAEFDDRFGRQSLVPSSAGGPLWLFGAIYALFIAFLIGSRTLLADRVATHFGFEGQADGWMKRDFYLAFFAGLPLVVAGIFWLSCGIIQFLPAEFINLPRRDYWLLPQHRQKLTALMRRHLLGLASILVLFFAALHGLTISANEVNPPRLSMGGVLVIVIAFLTAIIIWIVRLLMQFAEPERIHATKPNTAPASPPSINSSFAPTERQLFDFTGILKFQSATALNVARFACLGFLGFLGYVGDIAGWEQFSRLFGMFGFFGFFGVAYTIEVFARAGNNRRGATLPEVGQTAHFSAPPRLSRKAIVGAVWAAESLLAFLWLSTLIGQRAPRMSEMSSIEKLGFIITEAGLIAGTLAVVGTTILGAVALIQIRRSQGRLRGVRLAFFDTLLFPLLLLDWRIVNQIDLTIHDRIVEHSPSSATFSGTLEYSFVQILLFIALCAFLDLAIYRLIWRATKKPLTGASASRFGRPIRKGPVLLDVVFLLIAVAASAELISMPHYFAVSVPALPIRQSQPAPKAMLPDDMTAK